MPPTRLLPYFFWGWGRKRKSLTTDRSRRGERKKLFFLFIAFSTVCPSLLPWHTFPFPSSLSIPILLYVLRFLLTVRFGLRFSAPKLLSPHTKSRAIIRNKNLSVVRLGQPSLQICSSYPGTALLLFLSLPLSPFFRGAPDRPNVRVRCRSKPFLFLPSPSSLLLFFSSVGGGGGDLEGGRGGFWDGGRTDHLLRNSSDATAFVR